MSAGQWPPMPVGPPGRFPGPRGQMFGGRGFPPRPRGGPPGGPRGPGPMGFRPGPPRPQGGWQGFPRGRMPAPGNGGAFNRNPDMSPLETWGVNAPPPRPPFKRPHPGPHGNQGQGNHGNYHKPGQKKPRLDKRELPENNKYFCEICDRGFKLEEIHKEHVSQHEKCTYEGCSYTAAPKLVRNHIQFQHKTGLAKKIWQLESKEDVAKWRAERKSNFPTQDNIAKKAEERKERVARGEVLETKQFGKMRNQRGGRGRDRGRGRGQGHDRDQGHHHDDQGEEGESPRGRGRNRGRRRGRGRGRGRGQGHDPSDPANPPGSPELPPLSSLRRHSATGDPLAFFGKDNDSDSDHEGGASNPVTMVTSTTPGSPLSPKAPLQLAGALGSLAAMYSDSESDSETPRANTTTINTAPSSLSSAKTDSISTTKTEEASSTMRDSSSAHTTSKIAVPKPSGLQQMANKDSPVIVNIEKSEENEAIVENSAPKEKAWDDEDIPDQKPPQGRPQSQGRYNQRKHRPHMPRKRLSLLEKLLAPDIRHERNVLLQCVRYIATYNFLGVNDKHTTDAESSTAETSHTTDAHDKTAADNDITDIKQEPSNQPVVDEEIWEDGVI